MHRTFLGDFLRDMRGYIHRFDLLERHSGMHRIESDSEWHTAGSIGLFLFLSVSSEENVSKPHIRILIGFHSSLQERFGGSELRVFSFSASRNAILRTFMSHYRIPHPRTFKSEFKAFLNPDFSSKI